MKKMLKKTLLTGIGLAVMTKDKVEQLAKKIAEEAKFPEAEGRKFVADLQKKSEEAKKNLEKKIEDTVKKYLEKLDVATKKDLKEIKDRLEKMEKENDL